MLKYIALFETDEEVDDIGVIFPDVPGCFASGKNYAEAFRNAHEALAAHLDWLKREGESIPEPRSFEKIKREWEDWKDWEKGGNFMVVPISYIPESKPSKYTVYMNSALMAKIDEVTDNRSAFLSKAAEMLLDYDHTYRRHTL